MFQPNQVVKLLERLTPLIVQLNKNCLGGVDPRTLRRWRNGSSSPSPAAFSLVGKDIWRTIHSQEGKRIHASVMDALKQEIPDAPIGSWKNQDEFGAWFYKIAETHRGNPDREDTEPEVQSPASLNPFTKRDAIRDQRDFFGRINELRRIRDSVVNRAHLQIIAPRRMGKSSMLYMILNSTRQWLAQATNNYSCVYIDMQESAVQTQTGWYSKICDECKWDTAILNNIEFSNKVRQAIKGGWRLILCLDEFEKFVGLRKEFNLDFFHNLRSLAQTGGLSIYTSSVKPLSRLCENNPDLSVFYNIISIFELGSFSATEAKSFVTTKRQSVEPFNDAEVNRILDFAAGHPLKLQIACYQVLEAKLSGTPLEEAIQAADREANELLPTAAKNQKA